MRFLYRIFGNIGIGSFLLLAFGCKKLVEAPAPVTSTNAANVYTSDATAAAVLTGIYTTMSAQNGPNYAGQNTTGLPNTSLYLGLSADELTLYYLNATTLFPFYTNQLEPLVSPSTVSFWLDGYARIFTINSAIQGLSGASGLTPAVRQQALGEAEFLRGFYYFYLVNLYGDVPLITGTDYTVNALFSRTPKAQVWQQIDADLLSAEGLLSTGYLGNTLLSTTGERVRPTKWAAAAMLARAYLYQGKWDSAQAQATIVINNTSLFGLDSLNKVFLKNSTEAIWQLQPTGTGTASNTGEGGVYLLPAGGPSGANPVYLRPSLVSSFEPGDERLTNWVNKVTVLGTTYYYPYKYRIGLVNTTTQEYLMVLRLAEQYLIRAEAEAGQNNLGAAAQDLNVIRTRAGLPPTTASTQAGLLAAIYHERQVELFTEWGHRWLDLKRTGAVDSVMGSVTPQKGGSWNSDWQYFPVPATDLQSDPNLTQTPGYQ